MWHCSNPKATSNYRKSYIGMEKTDPTDAYLIADFGRVGRTKKLEPWRGGQFIALKRLTRHRMHPVSYTHLDVYKRQPSIKQFS